MGWGVVARSGHEEEEHITGEVVLASGVASLLDSVMTASVIPASSWWAVMLT